nr:hypothetical protein [Tanacetum cinerariifolium]
MATMIEQQVALDEALVPSTQRDDILFSTIKVVSKHQNTQQYGAVLPIELTNKEISNTKAYKEYYACATGKAAPKPKASAKIKRVPDGSGTDEGTGSKPGVSDVPSDDSEEEISWNSSDDEDVDAQEKNRDDDEGDEKAKASKDKSLSALSEPGSSGIDEGTGSKPGVLDVLTDESEEELSWNSFDDEGADDKGKDGNGDEDNEGDDGEEVMKRMIMKKQGTRRALIQSLKPLKAVKMKVMVKRIKGRGLQASLEIEDSHVTLTPVKPDGQQESSSVSSQFVTSMLNSTLDAGMKSIFKTASTSVAPLPIHAPPMTHSTIATITTTSQAPILPTLIPSKVLQNLPTFATVFRFDYRLRSLEQNFSEVMQTNQFAGAVSDILGIVQHFMDQRMNKAVQVVVQLQSNRLREEAQKENDEFLRTVDENIKKIIKEQVKEQVNTQVSKILPRIEQAVNEQLEAKVLTRSSHSSRTSYSLVDAYESDKIILDTYGETVTLKRRRDDDEDKDEETFAGPDRGSKRRREGKEPESASTPSETTTKSTGRSTTGSRSRQALASESAFTEEPVELAKQADTQSSFNELLDTPLEFSNFIMNQLRVNTLTPEILAGPTYELMKGSCKSLIQLEYHLEEPLPLIPDNRGRRVIPFAHFINNDLEYLRGGGPSRKYTTFVTKTNVTDYRHIKWIEDLVPRTMWIQEPIDYDKHALWGVSHWGRKHQQFYGFAVNRESARDVYSKRRIITIAELKIVEWHSYKHLDWITVRRDDDKLYKFKEGDFKRLRLQDIEDMLLLLVQGKLSNLTVEERFTFNVSLRMFTRSIVIQRRVEDLQLGVESYQKRLNLTKPDTYRFDLKQREAYTAYSNP